MIKLKDILEENYSHMRYLVSDLKNLYYSVNDDKLKRIILDLIPSSSSYVYTPQKADFYIKKFDELAKLSKKVLKPNDIVFKDIQKIVNGGLTFWNQREGINEEQPHQKEMIDGIVEMLVQVKDIDNRKQMALDRLRDFKKEGIEVNADEFMERCGLGEMNEKWSAKYKKSINCSNPKGFSQKAHCQGRKKREVVEEAIELFLEKNCPTDPAKWSASKAAAKAKFDVYPSAYANGWAAKNYKSKGGGWKTCKG